MVCAKNEYHRLYCMSVICYEPQRYSRWHLIFFFGGGGGQGQWMDATYGCVAMS